MFVIRAIDINELKYLNSLYSANDLYEITGISSVAQNMQGAIIPLFRNYPSGIENNFKIDE